MLAIIAALLVRLGFRIVFGWDYTLAFAFPAIAVAAWYGGLGPGLFATVAALFSGLVIAPPLLQLAVTEPREQFNLVLLFATGVMVSVIMGRLRAATLEAKLQSAEAKRQASIATAATARMVSVLESMNEAFIVHDREWTYTYVNAAAERLLGVSRQSLLGTRLWKAFPDLVGTDVERQFRRAVAESITVEFETYRTLGQAWYQIKAFPPHDGGLVVMFHDITERKRLLEHLQAGNERLSKAVEERTAELRGLTHALLTSSDDDRAKLATELHDELGSHLIAANLDVLSLLRPMSASAPQLLPQLQSVSQMLVTTNELNRRIMEQLQPSILDTMGLGSAVQGLCKSFERNTGQTCELHASGGDLPLDAQTSLTLYRILEASLEQVSRTGAVAVSLVRSGDAIHLTVTDSDDHLLADSGRGWPTAIIEMKERAARLHGSFEIRPDESGRRAMMVAVIPFA